MYFRAGRFGALTALLLPVLVLAKASGLASADPKKKTELRVQRERESHGDAMAPFVEPRALIAWELTIEIDGLDIYDVHS
jgi:hypothetical protein